MLRYIDYAFYAILLVTVGIAAFKDDLIVIITQVIYFISSWAITLINCFSMRRISNELLYVNNILANKRFMTVYTWSFTIISI